MAKQPAAWGFKDKSDAEILKQVARERRVDARLTSGAEIGKLPASAHRYARFVNESGEVIPARALMAVIGTTVIAGLEYYRVEKPGTTLLQDFEHLKLKTGCGCQRYAQMMDSWGVEKCRDRKAEIVQHLLDEAGVTCTELPFGLDLADLLGDLVDEAVRLAKAAQE